MKILILEHPRISSETRFNDIANAPLWSCLLAGYTASALLAAGHEAEIIDTQQNKWDFQKTKKEVIRTSPALLLINAIYFWEHTDKFFDFLKDLRAAGYLGHINLFGFFPTLAWDPILKYSQAVDSIATGEPEQILVELADRLQLKKGWRDIPGMAHKTDGRVVYNGFRKPEKNPDLFPFPVRNDNVSETASILASRGCYNACSFCPVPSFYNNGPLWRGRTPSNIMAEISQLYDQGRREFYFIDPNFVGPGINGRRRIFALAEQLQKLGITYGIETRPNDLDDTIMDALVSSGLTSLLLGIESGSSDILDGMGKHSSRTISENAIKICRSAGLEPEAGFLMFVPDSGIEDIERNFSFLKQNLLLDKLDRTVNLLSHYQIVLLGTPGYQLFENRGMLVKKGVAGFEADVVYRSKRVKWLKDVMVEVCRYILKIMSEKTSPVYWKKSDQAKQLEVNNFIVNLFNDVLQQAKKEKNLPSAAILTVDLKKDLNNLLTQKKAALDCSNAAFSLKGSRN